MRRTGVGTIRISIWDEEDAIIYFTTGWERLFITGIQEQCVCELFTASHSAKRGQR